MHFKCNWKVLESKVSWLEEALGLSDWDDDYLSQLKSALVKIEELKEKISRMNI